MTTERTLTAALASSAPMRAVYSDGALLAAMLRFEAALARAEADLGVIPAAAADVISTICETNFVDVAALALEAPAAGNLAIPLIKQLKARVAHTDAAAAAFVHWGATSQDVIDTAAMLQARAAIAVLSVDLKDSANALAAMAMRYRHVPMAGRTWLQQATPVTVGLKAAGWLNALLDVAERLDLAERSLPLQFGGASGTLAALGAQGEEVGAQLCRRLDLRNPELPWHGDRITVVAIGSAVALLIGALGKAARDIALMMQSEVAEMSEAAAPGRGGSSTMAHKRNPVGCAIALAAATRAPGLVATLFSAMVQEHERGLGGWQAEWGVLPELFLLASGTSSAMCSVFVGLEVDEAQILLNLQLGGGVSMAEAATFALAEVLGRQAAQKTVEEAIKQVRDGRATSLLEALLSNHAVDQELGRSALTDAVNPANYLGSSAAMVDRVLVRHADRYARDF